MNLFDLHERFFGDRKVLGDLPEAWNRECKVDALDVRQLVHEGLLQLLEALLLLHERKGRVKQNGSIKNKLVKGRSVMPALNAQLPVTCLSHN